MTFGALVFVYARRWRYARRLDCRWPPIATAAYALHVMLDFVSVNAGTRRAALVADSSMKDSGSTWLLFGHFRYTDIRDGIWSVVRPESSVADLSNSPSWEGWSPLSFGENGLVRRA